MGGRNGAVVEDIILPQIGETSEDEITVLKWKKQPGEQVRKGEALLEVDSGKSVIEIESAHEGILQEIVAAEGSKVKALAVVGRIRKAQ